MPSETHYFRELDAGRLTNSSKNNNEFEPRFKKLEESCFGNSIQFQEITKCIETIDKELDEKNNSYSEGFRDGKIAAEREKTNSVENSLNHLFEATEKLRIVQKKIQLEMERKIVALSIAVAKKIICQEVKIDEKIIIGVIKNALNKIDKSTHIKIKISPKDYSILKKYKEEMSTLNKFEYILEPSISKGGFIIETRNGIIDATIEEQIDTITKAFDSISTDSDQGLTI